MLRARKPTRLSIVLTCEKIKSVLSRLHGDKWPMASLIYGAGLLECLQLRVQDIDFAHNEITVRGGKGGKDRMTTLPGSLKKPLAEHLRKVRAMHEKGRRKLRGDGFDQSEGSAREKRC